MGIIGTIQPGSIKTVEDFTVAIELILADLFRHIGSSQGRSGDMINFLVDSDSDTDQIDVGILVQDWDVMYTERKAHRDAAAAADPDALKLTEGECNLIRFIRDINVNSSEAIRRIVPHAVGGKQRKPAPEPDDGEPARSRKHGGTRP